ncbi:hypothetical protein FAUST_10725 [Fusarium austroamericanum]|uniref:amidase n=1 Tax=Fusarium austroamericanum TaxID=282268 RepID=A0AAN5Z0C9_FUSAU|nr:hypothetical protein FAUST_10725 [Fusarium austroamericanum]
MDTIQQSRLRCLRLQISCGADRPLRRRGRPKKGKQGAIETNTESLTLRKSPPPDVHSPEVEQRASPPSNPSQSGSVTEWQHEGASEAGAHSSVAGSTTDYSFLTHGESLIAPDETTNPQIDPYACHDDGNSEHTPAGDPSSDPQTDAFESLTSDEWLDSLSDTRVHRAMFNEILERILTQNADKGILSLIYDPSLNLNLLSESLDGQDGNSAPELLYTTLSIGVQMMPDSLPVSLQQKSAIIIDTLRITSLQYIPLLTWKSTDLRLSQCVSLLLASHTWSMCEDLVEVSYRWGDIAGIIWRNVNRSETVSTDLIERVGRIVKFQSTVLGFLHHSTESSPFSSDQEKEVHPVSPVWYSSPAAAPSWPMTPQGGLDDFLEMLFPLVKLIPTVCSSSRSKASMLRVRDALELYYLSFPTSLLEYESLKYTYQAEAMVWFHGIFILTYIQQDIFSILCDARLQTTAEFYSALEHALLLGEILPTILAIDSKAQNLSSATVLFVLISSAVVSAACWLFHDRINDDDPRTLLDDAPNSLIRSAASHRKILEAICFHGSRYTVGMISPVHDLLFSLSFGRVEESVTVIDGALTALSQYRWIEGGGGIGKKAQSSSELQMPMWSPAGVIGFGNSFHLPLHVDDETTRERREMRTTTTTITVQHQEPRLSRWERIAARKQDERDKAIAFCSTVTLGKSTPSLPESTRTNVRNWPKESGDLTDQQIAITEAVPSHILDKISSGIWTAEQVLLAFVARATIAHYLTNPITEIFLQEALQRARELDHYFRQHGKTVGPLHGLPISLKDVINLKGHTTTIGFIARADARMDDSDELATRLCEAGAVFYCKTNVPQFLMSGECNNLLYGRTVSADNTTLSAGGSSGGEGSLISLGGSPLGIGTDIAGSIRTPANFNGIYGLCPSYGRFPLHSAKYVSPSYLIRGVAGPMSRSIDGLEVYTKALLSTDPWDWDFSCINMPWNQLTYDRFRDMGAAGNLTFGFVHHDGVVRPHPPIERGMREVASALKEAGFDVVDVNLFDGDERMWETLMKVLNCAGGKDLRDMVSQLHEPIVPETAIPPAMAPLTADELLKQGKHIYQLRQQMLWKWQLTKHVTANGRPVDVFILPSGGHVAPPHGTMDYFLYEAISNILDWTCATIPVGRVDAKIDTGLGEHANCTPMSTWDSSNRAKYSPSTYDNGAICLQVMGQRFTEEKVLACMRAVDGALGRDKDYVAS